MHGQDADDRHGSSGQGRNWTAVIQFPINQFEIPKSVNEFQISNCQILNARIT
jgi:hypothetical protein